MKIHHYGLLIPHYYYSAAAALIIMRNLLAIMMNLMEKISDCHKNSSLSKFEKYPFRYAEKITNLF